MLEPAEAQLDKLPKWAINHIQVLQANLESAQRKLAQHLGDYDPEYPCYGDCDAHKGRSLPCRQVWFRNAGITVRAEGDAVRIFADGQLTITPNVTNVIEVRSAFVRGMEA